MSIVAQSGCMEYEESQPSDSRQTLAQENARKKECVVQR